MATDLHRFTRILSYLCLSVFICGSVHAQDDEVVKVKSNLVNIDVIVKDKKGKYVSDLKPEDFVITENGVAQKIEFFDAPLSKTETAKPGVTVVEAPTTTTPATAPRNYISLVLDSQSTDLTNLKQVREGAIRYVREQVTDSDVVAILSVTNNLRMLQPFTQDKAKLIATLENLGTGSDSKSFEGNDIAENIARIRDFINSADAVPNTGITTNAGGSAAAQVMLAHTVLQQFIRMRTALSLQQARPVLAALAALSEGLRRIPGKKTLVLFSQGFVSPEVLDWQVQSTIDIANRANVAIYIIDSAGLRAAAPASGSLVPSSPLSGAASINQEQRIRAVNGETVFDNVRQEGQTREYDILYRLSGDTGGKFFKGNNDISLGLERINQEIQARYTLAYRSTNQNFDGTFRKVKIEVRRPDAQILSRSGYYAIPPEEIVLLSPADKKLLASFNEAQANPGLPVSVSFSAFRSGNGLYTVPLALEVPPSAVKFERKGDKQSMQLEVLGVLKGTPDRMLSRLGGNFDVNLSASDYSQILNNNIFYRQDLQLTSGDYTIDLIVRDKQSGKVTARREHLVLPEADAEFATTPVVLSRYVEPISQLPPDPAVPQDVLAHRKQLIRPSAALQFRNTDNLIMFLDVYNAANSTDTGSPLVRVSVRLMKDGQPASKFFDFVLTEIQRQPVPHLTFAEYLRLASLAPGRYQVMIETKDMVTHKSTKQEASFQIVP